MTVQQNLSFFRELVSCNYDLYFWEYDTEWNLLSSTCPESLLLDTLFTLSQCKEYVKNYPSDLPLLLSDSTGLMWSAVFEKEKDKISRIHVMGPVFINQNSKSYVEQALDKYNLSVANKSRFLRKFETLPLMTMSSYFQYTTMFHYSIRGEKLTVGDLQHQAKRDGEKQTFTQETDYEYTSKAQTRHQQLTLPKMQTHGHHGVRNVETELLSMVEQGNLNFKSILEKAGTVSIGNYSKIDDPIQHAKYSVFSFMILCSRSAIAGGLPAPTAYDLCDMYGGAIHNCKTLTETTLLSHTMYEDFIYRVHQCRQNSDVSKPIQTCCDYISMHITEDLDIELLADKVGYTSYYLSRKFKKEVGTSVNSYIREHKIEYAKHLLATTQQSIQEISSALHFCSRSYFADNFQKQVGMSPSDYREQHQDI